MLSAYPFFYIYGPSMLFIGGASIFYRALG